MKISVVTISYNQAPYLERCLDSILSQEGVELEYIVVDACSNDGSIEILERYRDRLSSLIIEKDKGAADGLNKGFAQASGDILYYLNSDDVVLPGAFARAAKVFAGNPDIDVVYGDGHIIDKDGDRVCKSLSIKNYTPYRYLVGAAMVFQQATFFRRSPFELIDGFNVENRTCWDGELLLDMAKQNAKFLHVPEFWGEFRLHPEGISGSGRLQKQYLADRARMFRSTYNRDLVWRDRVSRFVFRIGNKLSKLRR